MGLLDLDHASDSNLLKMVLNLEQRIQEIERAMPSGFFDHGSTGPMMSLPGSATIPTGYDTFPDGEVTMGVFRRSMTSWGMENYTDHFRDGAMPTGFAWAGAPFTTPTTIEWNENGTYFGIVPTSGGRHFLFDTISTYNDCIFVVRIVPNSGATAGIRIDNGTDNNYSEILFWAIGNGRMDIRTRYRTGGGGVTTTTWIPDIRIDIPVNFQLLWHSATAKPVYYWATETSVPNLANTPAGGWTPSRVGMVFQETLVGVGQARYDWFYSDFS